MGDLLRSLVPSWGIFVAEHLPQLCIVAIMAFTLLFSIYWLGRGSSSPRLFPPEAPGLPILGSVLDMARGPQQFLKECHEKLGDMFTLRLLTQRMSFVVDPAQLGRMFTAPESEVTFRPAVEQFTFRVFLLPPVLFCPQHMAMITSLRNFFAPGVLESHGRALAAKLQEKFLAWPVDQPVDLVEMIATTMFHASLETLFGAPFCKRHGHGAIYQQFLTFEGYFELAASPCPHVFLPRFCKARNWLLAAFADSLERGDFVGTPVETAVLRGVSLPPKVQPCVLLATIWASHANTLPSCFWAVAFLAAPPFAAIRDEVIRGTMQAHPDPTPGECEANNSTSPGSSGPATGAPMPGASAASNEHPVAGGAPAVVVDGCLRAALDRMHLLRRCVAEVLRLRAAGVDVRMAASDVAIGSYTIPKGHVIAVSPYLSHHDPRVYRDPCAFDPDRWLLPSREERNRKDEGGEATVDASASGVVASNSSRAAGHPGARSGSTAICPATMNTGPNGVLTGPGRPTSLTFGGGAYRCPGRYFAEMEVGLYAALFLQTFEVSLAPPGGCQGPGDVGASSGAVAGQPAAGCSETDLSAKGHDSLRLLKTAQVQEGEDGLQDVRTAPVRNPPTRPGGDRSWDSMDDGAGCGWLPPIDATRLVGVKVPMGKCYAVLKRRC